MKKRIFLICFSITIGIMSLKKSNIIPEIEGKLLNIRKLFEQNTLNYVCEKAGNSLAKKYEGGYEEKEVEKKALNNYQKAIIDFAKDTENNNIKKYLSRLVIFFIILGLDIILIFVWISYCCCSCYNCCCFKKASPPLERCRKVWFIISFICNCFIVILSLILLFVINLFLKRLNGVACSMFHLIDHIRDGVGKSYPKVINGWIGISGIKTIFEQGNFTYNKISDNSELKQKINYAKNNYTEVQKDDKCGVAKDLEYNDFDKDFNYLNILVNSSLNDIDFEDNIHQADEVYDTLTKIENKDCIDVYDALHDYINNIVKRVCYSIFSLTLVMALFAIVFLVFYFIFELNCFRIIYVFIWNISLLLMLLSILIGVIFGFFSYVLHDGVRIIQYILSKQNLDNPDPLIFDNNSFASDVIDVCVNGDGNFLKVIQEKEELKKYIEDIKQKQIEYNNITNSLYQINCNDDQGKKAKQSFLDVYETLYEQNSELLNLNNNLTSINCGFAKNDEMIILRQTASVSKKAKYMCGISISIGILFGISILAGILFVHRYKYELSESMPNKFNFKDPNESTMNPDENNINTEIKNL